MYIKTYYFLLQLPRSLSAIHASFIILISNFFSNLDMLYRDAKHSSLSSAGSILTGLHILH